jgi:hypothetical protein
MTSVDVVQRQVDAYNAHDAERFAGCYSAGAVIEDGVGTVLYEGSDAIREGYTQKFAESPKIHADILTRIHVGAWVLDEENITGMNVAGSPPEAHKAVVYRVEGDKIVRVRLLT